MAGLQRFEHALLRVNNLEKAVDFYKHVMDLPEIAREGGVVYFGCGFDGNYDLAVVEGGTGVSRFAVRVDSEEDIQRYEKKLNDQGVQSERINQREPGVEYGIRFLLPSNVTMELVAVEDNRYHRPSDPPVRPGRTAITPLDADHINLMSLDVKKDAEFLTEVLGYYLSDVKSTEAGYWAQAFTRQGNYHHDVAISASSNPQYNLHHYAMTMANFEHMKLFCDKLSQSGYQLELGLSRHITASNLFLYFWEPGGNRIELCCEMGTLSPNTPTRFTEAGINTFTAWGGITAPPTFITKGS